MVLALHAHDDALGVHRIHDAVAAGQHHGAGIARRHAFHAGSHQGSGGAQQRHRLALHVGAHQRAVGVVMLQEGHQRRGHRDELLRADVDVIDLVPRHQHSAIVRHGEGDVRSIGDAALPVVLVPAFVDRDLGFIASMRDAGGVEGVDTVAVDVLQPGAQAVGLPVAGAAEGRLEAAGRDGDDWALVVGDPMGLVIVVEFDRGGRGQLSGILSPPGWREAVVLVPAIVEGGFILVVAGREGPCALPDVVGRVIREMGLGAVRLPVAGAAQLTLQVPAIVTLLGAGVAAGPATDPA